MINLQIAYGSRDWESLLKEPLFPTAAQLLVLLAINSKVIRE